MSKKPNKTLRYIVRGLSGLLIAFLLLMFFGENSDPTHQLSTNAIIQLSVTAVVLIGLALAWKWELVGGLIALMAFVVLAIINPTVLDVFLMLLYPITALIFIVLGLMGRKSLWEWIDKLEKKSR